MSSAVPPVVEGKRHSTLSARQPLPPMWQDAVRLLCYKCVCVCVCLCVCVCVLCVCVEYSQCVWAKRGGFFLFFLFFFGLFVPLGSFGPVGCSIFGIGGGFTNHSA